MDVALFVFGFFEEKLVKIIPYGEVWQALQSLQVGAIFLMIDGCWSGILNVVFCFLEWKKPDSKCGYKLVSHSLRLSH